MGFTNQILGSGGLLLREQIQSANYEPFTSGWVIKQNGDVEFNEGNFRGSITAPSIILDGASGDILVYTGIPAAGNLAVAISGAAGVDQYGNAYGAGITVTDVVDTPLGNTQINGTFNVGNGIAGKTYFESRTLAYAAQPSGLIPFNLAPSVINADYPTGWGANKLWTCPENGWYSVSLLIDQLQSLGDTYQIQVDGTDSHNYENNVDIGSWNAILKLVAGDTVGFHRNNSDGIGSTAIIARMK